jgi:hypothetical protein
MPANPRNQGIVFAAGEHRQSTHATIEVGTQGETGGHMIAMAGGWIVGGRVEDLFQAPHSHPVVLDPRMERGEAWVVRWRLAVKDEASAHQLGVSQRSEICHHPIGGRDRVGIRADEDTLGDALLIQPGSAGIEGPAPRGADMRIG